MSDIRLVRLCRLWASSVLQRAAWRLDDTEDNWAIEYRMDGNVYGTQVNGRYSMARARCRELHGKIVGCQLIVEGYFT